MSVKSTAVTVGTSPTRIDSTTFDRRSEGVSVSFFNGGSGTVYVGGPDVTTSNGAPVAEDSWSPGFDLRPNDALYAVVATGTATVRVIEVGVG